MAHRFSVKDVAIQAGVSEATVDRVLNARPGVRRTTEDRVRRAVVEMEEQAGELARSGRKLVVDVVAEAPQVFLDALHEAMAAELPLQPVGVRARADIRARFAPEDMEAVLTRISRRESDGVLLMAPDAGPVRRGVEALGRVGVPVVTLASDLPGSERLAYVGLDNARAGETAAWLVARWARAPAPDVLVTIRNDRFRGEEEREAGFRVALARARPDARLGVVVEGRDGADFAARVLGRAGGGLDALYSIGGANRRILAGLEAANLPRPWIIAHDLDLDNRELLATGRIDAVLYHDLREDVRNAVRAILSSRGKGTGPVGCATLRIALPPMMG